MTTFPTVLVTRASSGIGATYADRFAIPALHVAGRRDVLDGARQGLMADIRQAHAAERYQPQA